MHETLNLEPQPHSDGTTAVVYEFSAANVEKAGFSAESQSIDTGIESNSDESAEQSEEQTVTKQSRKNEFTDGENWDAELFAFVSTNANEIVILNGAEMTLSAAMFLIPFSKETVEAAYAQAQKLVAEAQARKNQQTEQEDGAEEDVVEAEKPAEKLAEKPTDDKPADNKNNKNKVIHKDDEKIAVKPIAQEVQIKIAQPQPVRVSEVPIAQISLAQETPAPLVEQSPRLEVTQPIHPKADVEFEAPALDKSHATTEVTLATEVNSPPTALPELEDTIVVKPESRFLMDSEDGTIESPEAVLPEFSIELTEIPEPLLDSEIEVPEGIFEPGKELQITRRDDEALVAAPEDTLTAGLEENYFELAPEDGALAVDYEPAIQGNAGVISDIGFQEILEAIEEEPGSTVNETLELAIPIDAGKKEAIYTVLDKITEITVKTEPLDELATTEETQEQLEELFEQLLENLNIDYMPEQVGSLVRTVINNGNWQEEVMKLIDKKQQEDQPQSYGTNEIISQILSSSAMDDKAAELGSMLGALACALTI